MSSSTASRGPGARASAPGRLRLADAGCSEAQRFDHSRHRSLRPARVSADRSSQRRLDPYRLGQSAQPLTCSVEATTWGVIARVDEAGLDVHTVYADGRRTREPMAGSHGRVGRVDDADSSARSMDGYELDEHLTGSRMVRAVREPQELDGWPLNGTEGGGRHGTSRRTMTVGPSRNAIHCSGCASRIDGVPRLNRPPGRSSGFERRSTSSSLRSA